MKVSGPMLATLIAVLLAGCKSAPMTYYTLTPADRAATNDGNAGRPVQAILVMRPVPAEIDTLQIVIRTDDKRIRVEENARWSAPFADEVRAALIDALRRQSGIQISTSSLRSDSPLPRIDLTLQKYDAMEGSSVSVVADWTLFTPKSQPNPALVCQSVLKESAHGGMDDLVSASQRVFARLAQDIGAAIQANTAGDTPGC
jgi:uncharacterized protein